MSRNQLSTPGSVWSTPVGFGLLCVDVPVAPSEAGPAGHLRKAPAQSSLSTKGHIPGKNPVAQQEIWVPQHVLQDLGASTRPAGPGTSAHPVGEPQLVPLESSQLPAPATVITPGPTTSSELMGSRECTDTIFTSSSLTSSGRKVQLWPKRGPFMEHQHFSPAQLPALPDHSKNIQGFSFSPLCCCGCENTLNK